MNDSEENDAFIHIQWCMILQELVAAWPIFTKRQKKKKKKNPTIFRPLVRSQFGLAVRGNKMVSRRISVRFRFGSALSSKAVVSGDCFCDFAAHN